MRIKGKVEIPARTEARTVAVRCDLCGVERRANESWPHRADENSCRTTLELIRGTHWNYEDDFRKRTEFDICGDCFEQKLIPWMKAQGAEPRERDADDWEDC